MSKNSSRTSGSLASRNCWNILAISAACDAVSAVIKSENSTIFGQEMKSGRSYLVQLKPTQVLHALAMFEKLIPQMPLHAQSRNVYHFA